MPGARRHPHQPCPPHPPTADGQRSQKGPGRCVWHPQADGGPLTEATWKVRKGEALRKTCSASHLRGPGLQAQVPRGSPGGDRGGRIKVTCPSRSRQLGCGTRGARGTCLLCHQLLLSHEDVTAVGTQTAEVPPRAVVGGSLQKDVTPR